MTRRVADAATGAQRAEDEVLEIGVLPGWKKGTKLTFKNKGVRLLVLLVLVSLL